MDFGPVPQHHKGNSHLYCMDNMEFMKQIPDKWFGLVADDFPYGINVGGMAYLKEQKNTVKQKNGTRLNPYSKKRYTKKEWDDKTPTQEYFDEIKRISKHQIMFGTDYVNWEGLGSGKIIWDKGQSEGVSFKRYESAYCSFIEDEITIPLLWAGMMQAKSVLEPMTQQGNKKKNEKRIHPCQKPVMLYHLLLKMFDEEIAKGNPFRVYDPDAGSANSRLACFSSHLDIEYYGTEIDPEHYTDSIKRFTEQTAQLKLF